MTTIHQAVVAIRQAEKDLLNGAASLRFVAECERAVYEGRVSLPGDLLAMLAASSPFPAVKETTKGEAP